MQNFSFILICIYTLTLVFLSLQLGSCYTGLTRLKEKVTNQQNVWSYCASQSSLYHFLFILLYNYSNGNSGSITYYLLHIGIFFIHFSIRYLEILHFLCRSALSRRFLKPKKKNSKHADDRVETRSRERKQYIVVYFKTFLTVVISNLHLQAWNIKDVKQKII